MEKEKLKEILERLDEDSVLLELSLLGAQVAIDRRTLCGLLRLSDDIKQQLRELTPLVPGWPR